MLETLIAIAWLISAGFGALIGHTKGQAAAGIFWGFVLGPFGWFLVLSLPDPRPTCEECGGIVIAGARKCKNCGAAISLTQLQSPNDKWEAALDHGKQTLEQPELVG